MINANFLGIVSIVTSTDDEYFDLTLKSLIVTLQSIKPEATLIVCPLGTKKIPEKFITKYNMRQLLLNEVELYSYSYFLLRYLNNILLNNFSSDVSHLLVHQWDSCIIRPDLWTDEFLNYDYIGAPWPFFLNYDIPKGNNILIGNGGFSIRSRAFLSYSGLLETPQKSNDISDNEDILSCVKYQNLAKSYIGRDLIFPSLDLARRFSIERQFPKGEYFHKYEDLSSYNSFGFHGKFNTAGMNYINKTWETINNE